MARQEAIDRVREPPRGLGHERRFGFRVEPTICTRRLLRSSTNSV